jgi:hypothetical protein
MGVVLDLSLAADQGQQPCRVGTLWSQARDTGHYFLAHLPRFFDADLALQPKHLRQPRPVTVPPPYVAGLQPALLDAAMPERGPLLLATPQGLTIDGQGVLDSSGRGASLRSPLARPRAWLRKSPDRGGVRQYGAWRHRANDA